jgi:hypothetical protein
VGALRNGGQWGLIRKQLSFGSQPFKIITKRKRFRLTAGATTGVRRPRQPFPFFCRADSQNNRLNKGLGSVLFFIPFFA